APEPAARPAESQPEQPGRRRRQRERRAVPDRLPLRRDAAPGLRARAPPGRFGDDAAPRLMTRAAAALALVALLPQPVPAAPSPADRAIAAAEARLARPAASADDH